MSADLHAIAAGTLRRLAVEMRAAATIPPAPSSGDDPHAITRESNRRMLAETRREAAADLSKIAHATDFSVRLEARSQHNMIYSGAATADEIDAWATAWEASP